MGSFWYQGMNRSRVGDAEGVMYRHLATNVVEYYCDKVLYKIVRSPSDLTFVKVQYTEFHPSEFLLLKGLPCLRLQLICHVNGTDSS